MITLTLIDTQHIGETGHCDYTNSSLNVGNDQLFTELKQIAPNREKTIIQSSLAWSRPRATH